MIESSLKSCVKCFLFFFAVAAFLVPLTLTCYGGAGEDAEYTIGVDFSPNIINIESERLGEIRILTNMRYSFYASSGLAIFVYFNGSESSVENIRATRDSRGNLIIKFNLVDLLKLENNLYLDNLNRVEVVVLMQNEDEYNGWSEVFIAVKGTP
jgi:hypothetical protein